IHLGTVTDEHAPTDLQAEDRVRYRFTFFGRDQRTVAASRQVALLRSVAVDQAVPDAGATRVGEEFALVADQTTRRDIENDAGLATAGGAHIDHFTFALADLIDHDAGMFVIHVDNDFVDRLKLAAGRGIFLKQYPGARHGKLEAFTAHGF